MLTPGEREKAQQLLQSEEHDGEGGQIAGQTGPPALRPEVGLHQLPLQFWVRPLHTRRRGTWKITNYTATEWCGFGNRTESAGTHEHGRMPPRLIDSPPGTSQQHLDLGIEIEERFQAGTKLLF